MSKPIPTVITDGGFLIKLRLSDIDADICFHNRLEQHWKGTPVGDFNHRAVFELRDYARSLHGAVKPNRRHKIP